MDFAQALEGCSAEDARSCLYYAARYIKQAGRLNSYEKDIFEDGRGNAPSDNVRAMTVRIIEAIETREGTQANQFNDETIIRLLDEITAFEGSLSPELSEAELSRGASLAAEMSPPSRSQVDD